MVRVRVAYTPYGSVRQLAGCRGLMVAFANAGVDGAAHPNRPLSAGVRGSWASLPGSLRPPGAKGSNGRTRHTLRAGRAPPHRAPAIARPHPPPHVPACPCTRSPPRAHTGHLPHTTHLARGPRPTAPGAPAAPPAPCAARPCLARHPCCRAPHPPRRRSAAGRSRTQTRANLDSAPSIGPVHRSRFGAADLGRWIRIPPGERRYAAASGPDGSVAVEQPVPCRYEGSGASKPPPATVQTASDIGIRAANWLENTPCRTAASRTPRRRTPPM